MAPLPRPLTTTTSRMPARTASSTTSWIVGVSTIGSISLGTALVAGKKRVPSPAAGITALRTCAIAMAGEVSILAALAAAGFGAQAGIGFLLAALAFALGPGHPQRAVEANAAPRPVAQAA